jgi:hypothetical protein
MIKKEGNRCKIYEDRFSMDQQLCYLEYKYEVTSFKKGEISVCLHTEDEKIEAI